MPNSPNKPGAGDAAPQESPSATDPKPDEAATASLPPGVSPSFEADPPPQDVQTASFERDGDQATRTHARAGGGQPDPPTPPGEGGIARYKLLEEIGKGGMGVVYKARQNYLNRIVAVKLIKSRKNSTSREVGRFLAEAEVIAEIRHPNVVQIFEVGRHNGQPFMVLEYVEGGTLGDFLKARPPMNPRDAATLVLHIARGVDAAHQEDVVHRDLKPGILCSVYHGVVVRQSPAPRRRSRAGRIGRREVRPW